MCCFFFLTSHNCFGVAKIPAPDLKYQGCSIDVEIFQKLMNQCNSTKTVYLWEIFEQLVSFVRFLVDCVQPGWVLHDQCVVMLKCRDHGSVSSTQGFCT